MIALSSSSQPCAAAALICAYSPEIWNTSVGTPKAGVFAEGQAVVVADAISAQIRGASSDTTYDGHGMCYLEFGEDEIAIVNVTFLKGQAPFGDMEGPSSALAADKVEFGASRVCWGSNFPAAKEPLPELIQMARKALSFLPQQDQDQIFAKTALALYPALAKK